MAALTRKLFFIADARIVDAKLRFSAKTWLPPSGELGILLIMGSTRGVCTTIALLFSDGRVNPTAEFGQRIVLELVLLRSVTVHAMADNGNGPWLKDSKSMSPQGGFCPTALKKYKKANEAMKDLHITNQSYDKS